MSNVEEEARIHPVDVFVGNRIRGRRMQLGYSTTDVAHEVGISPQAFAKYEMASSRVSASRLYEIACILQVPVEYFFHGFQGNLHAMEAIMDVDERAMQVAMDYAEMKPAQQKAIKHVISVMKNPD